MSMSLDEWRSKLKKQWEAWRDDPRGKLRSLGTHSLYYTVAGSALYPVTAAIAQGDPAAAGLLASLGGAVGGNLLANVLQKGADEAALPENLAAAVNEHPEISHALDAILEELRAFPEIVKGMKRDDLAWFHETLHAERPDLASRITIGPVTNTGSGAIVIGGVGGGEGSVVVDGDLHGGINIGGELKKRRED